MENSTENITYSKEGVDFVGVGLIVLPITLAVPYVIILKIIISTDDLWEAAGYKFIFHLGVCDLVLLATHVATGVVSVTRCTCEILRQQLLGAPLFAAWPSYMGFTTVLSLNRWTAFSIWGPVQDWFTPANTKKWIGLCYSIGALWLMGSQTNFNCVFTQVSHTFSYEPEWFAVVDLVYCSLTMLVTTVAYVTAWVCIHKTVSGTPNPSSEMRAESRLAAQGLSVWLVIVFYLMVWFVAPFGSASWAYTMLYVFVNGSNPAIYIGFNKSIKTKFFQCFGWQPNRVQSVPVSRR